MKKILITGGAGFLGSHLCEKLLDEGHEVVCLDNFSTGKKNNVSHILNNQRFKLIQHDVVQPFYFEVDWIFNLACPASPIHYQSYPIHTMKTSVLGAINSLECAKKNNARILQASTSEVYGDPKVHPQIESYRGSVNPIGIRACYDEGKRAAETLFFDYYRQYELDIRVVRIFNTYGPHMAADDRRVVSNFIIQALEGKDITIYGDGKQTRSFCYVEDLIDGFIKMMRVENFTGPVNLGNPEEFTVLELAKLILELTASKSKIIYKPLPSDDPLQRCPVIKLAREKLDWSPKIKLKEGLERTIKYFKNLS